MAAETKKLHAYCDNLEHHLPYFSIYSRSALETKQFALWRANIPNTPESLELAKQKFNEDDFTISFHYSKIDISPVLMRY